MIELPKDRMRIGVLRFFDDSMGMCGAWPCLGKSSNAEAAANDNPQRLSTLRNGDTPTGTYQLLAVRSEGTAPGAIHSYGPNPVIALNPTSGDALTAKINGREGFLIHGGDLSITGALRPTFGCVRVSNPDMAALNGLMVEYGQPAKVIIEESA